MKKAKKRSGLHFEPGSKQPFMLYIIFIIIVSAIITIISLISSGLSVKLGSQASSLGDINNDGVVNSADSLLLMKYIVGQTELDSTQRVNADVDRNDTLNSKDALLIIQFSSGSSTKIGKPSENDSYTALSDNTVASQSETHESEQTSEPVSQEQETTEKEFLRSGSSDNAAYFSTDKNIYFTARISNKWTGSNGKHMYQIEIKVKNNSSKSIYNTSAYISFSSESVIDKTWGCSIKNSSQPFKTITNNESTLYPGGTYSYGFTVASDSSDLSISSFTKQNPQAQTSDN